MPHQNETVEIPKPRGIITSHGKKVAIHDGCGFHMELEIEELKRLATAIHKAIQRIDGEG